MSTLTQVPVVATVDTLAIERRGGLSVKEFVHEHLLPRRPVILTDATRDWNARNWTPESLLGRLGQRPVKIRTPQGTEEIPFDVLSELIAHSSEEFPAPYARNIDIEGDLPELWPDVLPRLPYACPDWKSSVLLPKDFVFRNGLSELFYGGRGASFPRLHVDYWGMDGFVCQMYGAKEFILLGPDQDQFVYPGDDHGLVSQIDDIMHVDLQRFPLHRQAKPIRFTLLAGETLYMPNRWWHTTYMPGTSLTVILAMWHRRNWGRFVYEYRCRAKVSKPKKLAMLAYLSALGLGLSCRDRLAGR